MTISLKTVLGSIAYNTFRNKHKVHVYRSGKCNRCGEGTTSWFCNAICERAFRELLGHQYDLRLEEYP